MRRGPGWRGALVWDGGIRFRRRQFLWAGRPTVICCLAFWRCRWIYYARAADRGDAGLGAGEGAAAGGAPNGGGRVVRRRTAQLLEPLVDAHIRKHGDDPQQSLAAISSVSSLPRQLAELADEQLRASLIHIGGEEPTLAPTRKRRYRYLPASRQARGSAFCGRTLKAAWAGVRRPGRRAEPRGRAQGDSTGACRRPGQPGAIYWRPRSPAAWSIRASCRSSLGPYADGRPFYAMRFIRGRQPQGSDRAVPRRRRREPQPGRCRRAQPAAAAALAPPDRRVRGDRLRPQPRRAAPRFEAGQHHAGAIRRDAGRRLGVGQGAGNCQ